MAETHTFRSFLMSLVSTTTSTRDNVRHQVTRVTNNIFSYTSSLKLSRNAYIIMFNSDANIESASPENIVISIIGYIDE